jgi:hypothetical protein
VSAVADTNDDDDDNIVPIESSVDWKQLSPLKNAAPVDDDTFFQASRLNADRLLARQAFHDSAVFRWTVMMAEMQTNFWRKAEKIIRDGEAPSPLFAFWYKNPHTSEVFRHLAYLTYTEQKISPSRLHKHLALSYPFLRQVLGDAKELGYINDDFTLSNESAKLHWDRVTQILQAPSVRKFARGAHVLGLLETMDPDILAGAEIEDLGDWLDEDGA